MKKKVLQYMLFSGLLTFSGQGDAQKISCEFEAFDDRKIRIAAINELQDKRTEIIRAIWNADQLPSRDEVILTTNAESPIHENQAVSSVTRIEVPVLSYYQGNDIPDPLLNLAYLFFPHEHNGRLAIFHNGHSCTLKADPEAGPYDAGVEATIIGLLEKGFEVLAVYMPHVSADTCTLDHCSVMNSWTGEPQSKPTHGLRFFLDPTLVCLNYMLGQKDYQDISMIGLSGGGWTTTLISAVDDRITASFSIAGTMPVYYRNSGSIGDIEQYLPELYRDIAGYPELYLMSAFGKGRSHFQVFNRRDDCCFGEAQHDPERDYDSDAKAIEKSVRKGLRKLHGESRFRLLIDDQALNHQISSHTFNGIILDYLITK